MSDIQEIELSIEQSRVFITTADALNRLMKNEDFKILISVGYFKEEPARLVELKAAPQTTSEEWQASIIKSIDGIGSLQQYFNTIWGLAENARVAIEEGEEALVEIEAGEL